MRFNQKEHIYIYIYKYHTKSKTTINTLCIYSLQTHQTHLVTHQTQLKAYTYKSHYRCIFVSIYFLYIFGFSICFSIIFVLVRILSFCRGRLFICVEPSIWSADGRVPSDSIKKAHTHTQHICAKF